MFTGIVTGVGTVLDMRRTASGARLRVDGATLTDDLLPGDSIAVNGVCLTAVEVAGSVFVVDTVDETLRRTNLGELTAGHRVDLERPTKASGRFDGHLVQGHVDGVGVVESRAVEGDAERVRIGLPEALARYVVEKGSITVDGVSLTVTAVSPFGGVGCWFDVVLIPHTLAVTVLGERTVGDLVNLEVDLVAKYVERLLEVGR